MLYYCMKPILQVLYNRHLNFSMRSNFTPNTIKFDILCLPLCWSLQDYCDRLNVEFSCGRECVVQIFRSICSAYLFTQIYCFFLNISTFEILWRGPLRENSFQEPKVVTINHNMYPTIYQPSQRRIHLGPKHEPATSPSDLRKQINTQLSCNPIGLLSSIRYHDL